MLTVGWNYLRVRGEYNTIMVGTHGVMELPPRARRIPHIIIQAGNIQGTTSACAENTHCVNPPSGHQGNYLRVRGEYLIRVKRQRVA